MIFFNRNIVSKFILITETSLEALCYCECTEICFGMATFTKTMGNYKGHINKLFKEFSFVSAHLVSHCDDLLYGLH